MSTVPVPKTHLRPARPLPKEYQVETMKNRRLAARNKPSVFGTHDWNLADFRTGSFLTHIIDNHQRVCPRDRSPKLAAHILQCRWRTVGAGG